MPHSEIHKKKRRKNWFVFGLVLAWCALIWLIAMVKIANSAEIVPWEAEREAQRQHNQEMIQKWHGDDWEERASEQRIFLQEQDEQRAEHQQHISNQPSPWWDNWEERLNP